MHTAAVQQHSGNGTTDARPYEPQQHQASDQHQQQAEAEVLSQQQLQQPSSMQEAGPGQVREGGKVQEEEELLFGEESVRARGGLRMTEKVWPPLFCCFCMQHTAWFL